MAIHFFWDLSGRAEPAEIEASRREAKIPIERERFDLLSERRRPA